MKFVKTPLEGAYTIELEKRGDDRGFFARLFCSREFADMGLENRFVQINSSISAQEGTLRGFHYQLAPYQEDKVVKCIQGALYDVILDLRPESDTFGQHFGVILSGENRKMLFVPKGFAHAILTLEPNTEIFYLVSQYYSPQHERIIRWNDPKFQVEWPIQPTIISPKDMNQADFDPSHHLPEELAGVS